MTTKREKWYRAGFDEEWPIEAAASRCIGITEIDIRSYARSLTSYGYWFRLWNGRKVFVGSHDLRKRWVA